MSTKDLESERFTCWRMFNRHASGDLLLNVPLNFGVYIIRKRAPVRRTRGESDVIYIGSACNQNGLRGRIRQYFSPGPTQSTNQRILSLVKDSEEYEIGWCEVAAKSEAVGLEQQLLDRYCADHGERPPENRKG